VEGLQKVRDGLPVSTTNFTPVLAGQASSGK